MIKIFLILCFILFGFGQVEAQLRMDKAEAMGAMSTLVSTVHTKTVKGGEHEFIHYLNTMLNQETILRINRKGTCDQLITVLPMTEWNQYVKVFNGEVFPETPINKPAGKNIWKNEKNGTTITMVPHEDKETFSIVTATPEA